MRNHPIVMHDVDSVLRIGPAGMKNRGDWQQNDSDLFAHFIQVNRQISTSRWSSADCKFTKRGDEFIGGSFAAIEDFVYAAAYFRQLFSRSRNDQLFRRVVDRYTHFADDLGKAAWISAEHSAFKEMLDEPFFMLPDYTVEELIEA